MAVLAKIKQVFLRPKIAIGLLLGGFVGFIGFGSVIFLAEHIQSEWLAASSIGLMVLFGLVAVIGYLGVWYQRLFVKR